MIGNRFSSYKKYYSWLFCYRNKNLYLKYNLNNYLTSSNVTELARDIEMVSEIISKVKNFFQIRTKILIIYVNSGYIHDNVTYR